MCVWLTPKDVKQSCATCARRFSKCFVCKGLSGFSLVVAEKREKRPAGVKVGNLVQDPDLSRGDRVSARACAVPLGHQPDFGEALLVISVMSSTWLHSATNRSKNNLLPPISISICMVPLRLKVLRLRMIRARK